MNIVSITTIATYVLFVAVGYKLESSLLYLYYRKTGHHYKEHHFTYGKYLLFLIIPCIIFLLEAHIYGMVLVKVFAGSMIIGTFLEWTLGFVFYKIVGVKLWTYHVYPLGEYTSYLSIVFWGFAGVFFVLLARVAGF